METSLSVKTLFQQENVKQKFQELMGKKSSAFMTSVLQIVNSNNLLAKADAMSVFNSACVSATLDLPINNSLGFAYIIPFNVRQPDGSFKCMAQFQLGYRGLIQLAQRSGQFKTISATAIYEGQIKNNNPLTGIEFDFNAKKSDVVIGYAGYFELINGFTKTLFLSVDELKKHGLKYSKTFNNKNGLWNTDFDAMATKTVLKLLLGKYAPLSIEMQKAVVVDQSVINDTDGTDVTYADNETIVIDKEKERITLLLNDCTTIEDVQMLQQSAPDIDANVFENKITELKEKANV